MINEKDQQYLNYWNEKRKDGRWMYAFKSGILTFAWPIYLLSEVYKYFSRRQDWEFSWQNFLQGFLIWTVMGFIAFSLIMWWSQEKRYQNILKKESNK